jgi:hypothetical protein
MAERSREIRDRTVSTVVFSDYRSLSVFDLNSAMLTLKLGR